MVARSAPPALSFDQAPPLSVPFRFFLTAPLFLMLAGALLIAEGRDALASRWGGETLALVHLMVAGFLLQVMVGAVLQFVPVVTGGNVRRPTRLAALAHPALALGALALVAGFLSSLPPVFGLAVALLASGGLLFVWAVGLALWRATAQGPTLVNLRLAVAALAGTFVLGCALALALAGVISIPIVAATNAHALWGLGGWGLLLLAGVSCVVVPMFQMTGGYPPRIVKTMRVLVAGGAVLMLLPLVTSLSPIWGVLLMLAAVVIYAGATLRLQFRRRRRVPDHVLSLFRLGMGCALAVAALAIGLVCLVPDDARWLVLAGIWIIVGLFASTVLGMLYKIGPFLIWLHLQAMPGMKAVDRAGSAAMARPLPPDMNRMIPPAWAKAQRWLQLATVLVLSLAPWLDVAARIGGLLLVAGAVLLWAALGRATGIYRQFQREFRSQTRADVSPKEC